ncbi:4Fe-4S dicluster domain-containing protein, partial [Acinetobacter sp.]|nr:hypothetical protein [Acinetobacter sp.]
MTIALFLFHNIYCPAGVYEIVDEGEGNKRFQINAA